MNARESFEEHTRQLCKAGGYDADNELRRKPNGEYAEPRVFAAWKAWSDRHEALSVEQYLLSCLAEECAEVAQRISKALRFGLDEIQPGQNLSNAQRVVLELHDVWATLSMCCDHNILEFEHDVELTEDKKAKIRKYMEYSRSIGRLK